MAKGNRAVDPIKDKDKIAEMKMRLRDIHPKYELVFIFGINTGLRVSDIVDIKVSDIMTEKMIYRNHLEVMEKKTDHIEGRESKKLKLNDILKKTLKEYIANNNLQYNDYIFPSNKGGHVTENMAYKVMKKAAKASDIENFGTHSMRKTWAWFSYKTSKYNLVLIMKTLGHTKESVTLRYIGIEQEEKDELYSAVQL